MRSGEVPPAALRDDRYLLTGVAAGVAVFFRSRLVERLAPAVRLFDAARLGLFVVVGTVKALQVGLGAVPAFAGSSRGGSRRRAGRRRPTGGGCGSGAGVHRADGGGLAALQAGFPKEQGRRLWQQVAERFFADHDVLVTPALAQRPLPAHAWGQRGWLANVTANSRYAPFAAPWNLAGWPAACVPAGMHPVGTPLAVQLVARPGGEHLLLQVAAQLEQLRPWSRLAPL